MRTIAVSCLLLLACSAPPVTEPPLPRASAAHFTLECTPHGVGAYDASRSLIPGVKVSCTGHVGDVTGAPLEGVVVEFRAEAGRLRSGGSSSATGEVAAEFETAMPLPRDVQPGVFTQTPFADATHTGVLLAPAWMEPHRWIANPVAFVGNLTPPTPTGAEPRRPDPILRTPQGAPVEMNPRDNLVTLIAVTDGAEAFTDSNANGTFDPTETFVDTTEPFVDSNDDGTWDPEEAFIDTNGNGLWDGKNGVWDAAAKIWTQERVLWTGISGMDDMRSSSPVNGYVRSVEIAPWVVLSCPSSSAYCAQALGGPVNPMQVALYVADPWFNALTISAADDGCAFDGDVAPAVAIVSELSGSPPSPRLTWPAGDTWWFTVKDARDPAVPPSQQIPPRSPPVAFGRNVLCRSTAGAQQLQLAFTFGGTTQ